MSISAESYRQIGRRAAGAVSVVTAMERDGKGIVGLTVSSFVTLSFDPPLVMFAIQHDTNSYPAIVSSKAFGSSSGESRSNRAPLAVKGSTRREHASTGTPEGALDRRLPRADRVLPARSYQRRPRSRRRVEERYTRACRAVFRRSSALSPLPGTEPRQSRH